MVLQNKCTCDDCMFEAILIDNKFTTERRIVSNHFDSTILLNLVNSQRHLWSHTIITESIPKVINGTIQPDKLHRNKYSVFSGEIFVRYKL